MSLGTLLAETAARAPTRPALAFEGARVSYAELDSFAEAAVPEARLVFLPLPNVAESVALFHGALRHGSDSARLQRAHGQLEPRTGIDEARALARIGRCADTVDRA